MSEPASNRIAFLMRPRSARAATLCLGSVMAALFGLTTGILCQGPEKQMPTTSRAPAAAAPAGGDSPCPQPALLQKAIVPEIDTNQDTLNNRVVQGGHVVSRPSGYTFKTVLINGRHLFTTPFTEADGAGEGKHFFNGEGDLGLREESFNSNLRLAQAKLGLADSDFPKLLDIFRPPFSHIDSKGNVRFSILRMNGLDSQSCFECHNSIGSGHVGGEGPAQALERKPGTTGGPAGQASNAFINDTFPNPIMKFVRNPPHVFGTGYAQKLAEKMTEDLITQKVVAYTAAAQLPGTEVPVELYSTDSKGRPVVQFGTLKVTYIGDPSHPPDVSQLRADLLSDADIDLSKDFRENQTDVHGVSRDLVVRPFQWKGIASNERNFVRSALMFHFGMLPRELNTNYRQPQEDHDPDHDGVPDEVSEGNVSSLAVFTMSIRPPEQFVPPDKKQIVARGEKLFRGEKVDGETIVIGPLSSCANCHMPTLPLYDTKVCVRDPRDDVKPGEPLHFTNIAGLVASQASSKRLPIYRVLRAKFAEAHARSPRGTERRSIERQAYASAGRC